MRILQILPSLDYGGVERGTIDLSEKLVKEGHEAYCISAGGALVSSLKETGAEHYQLPVDKKSFFSVLSCVEKVAQVIRDKKIDLVHARSRVPAWIAYLACRRTETKFITTCHGYYAKHFGSNVMGWGSVCIVPSVVIGRHMIEDFGVSEDRIRVIPRGVDLRAFIYNPKLSDEKGEFVVAMIGRITPLKGHMYFLKAAAKLNRLIPRLKIIIAGSPPRKKPKYLDDLLTLTRRFGLEMCVNFIGNRKDIPSLLSGIDCLVMASTAQEAFGRVIIEAQAVGVPVVATRVGGIVDVVEDGQTGLMVDPCDGEAICRAVLKIYKDKELAAGLRRKAREKVEKNYSLDLMAERTIELYKRELAKKNILIIKLSALGDIILSTPGFRAIRKKFQNAKIFLLTTKASKEAVERCPYIDRIILMEKAKNNLGAILKTSRKLRRYHFDLVVDLQNNHKSHMISFFSGSSSRYGWDNGKFSFLLNHRQKWTKEEMDPVSHQQKLLELLDVQIKDRKLEFWISDDNKKYIDEFLRNNWVVPSQPLIGFNISSSLKWQSKRWPLENFIELADILAKEIKARIVLTGTNEDAGLCEYFEKNSVVKPINACGRTNFAQLAGLIQRCKVYVTGDSAPLHMAIASGTASVAFFGPTSAKRHILPQANGIILNKNLPCAPCYKSFCRRQTCLRQITVEEVKNAVLYLIADSV